MQSNNPERYRFLNRKEIKSLLERIRENWQAELHDNKFAFLTNSNNKLFIVSRDIDKLDLSNLRVNNIGLYFGEITERDELRLSIEGAGIVGKTAKKNIVEISKEDSKKWFSGEDIEIDSNLNEFVIVKCENDFLGCAKLAKGRLINFIPKARRIQLFELA